MTIQQLIVIALVVPYVILLSYVAWLAFKPDVKRVPVVEIEAYIEREARISELQMKIMDLKISIEVERQLAGRENRPIHDVSSDDPAFK